MTAAQTKQIKVNRSLYQRTLKDKHHHAFDRCVNESVPSIQMKGKWLAKAGFAIDVPVTVQVSDGRLVLTVES
jgi:Toxin SymE, type I toxin-antitoxin system